MNAAVNLDSACTAVRMAEGTEKGQKIRASEMKRAFGLLYDSEGGVDTFVARWPDVCFFALALRCAFVAK